MPDISVTPTPDAQQPTPATVAPSSQLPNFIPTTIATMASADAPPSATNIPPSAPQNPVQPSTNRWANALKGFMQGMAEGGIPGAVAGAVDPSRAQQTYDDTRTVNHAQAQTAMANVKFRDAEAAKSVSEAAAENYKLQSLPEENRIAVEKHSYDVAQFWEKQGFRPTMILDDTGPQAQAALQQLTETHGSVPPATVLHVNGKLVIYTAPTPGVGLDVVNNARSLQNIPAITEDQWKQMKPADQESAVLKSNGLFVPQGITNANGQSEMERRKLILSNYQNMNPNWSSDPAKAENVKLMSGAIQSIKDTLGGITKRDIGSFQAKKDIEAQSKIDVNDAKPTKPTAANTNMLVGSMADGTQVAGTEQELASAGAKGVTKLPAADQSKVYIARQLISPTGLLTQTQKALAAFSPEELSTIGSRWKEFEVGKLGAGDPRFVTLRTNAKLLSTALMQAHVGSRGSEGMMAHFENLADSGKMNAETLKSAFQAERDYVTEKAMMPKGQAAQTHAFSLGAWQKANPNGDANAAKAAAQSAGYQVVN